jgi:hypothetical protein
MKKVFAIVISSVLLVALLVPAAVFADNGAPDAKLLYHLNIIGVKYDKSMDNDIEKANGNVIFVDLEGPSKISLVEGDDFAVLDKNGTDRDGATFQMPDPGLDPYIVGDKGSADTEADYSVWVRPLGKPGGFTTITTCADLLESQFESYFSGKDLKTIHNAVDTDFGALMSIEQVSSPITLRTNGKGGKVKFTDVTAELLTIVFLVTIEYDDGGETVTEQVYVRVPIFDPMLENEYWKYDNNNLKLLQVRFYDYPVDVSAGDGDLPAIT